MTVTQKIVKVGNSLAITLPASLVREAGWKAGDEVAVEQNAARKTMYIKPPHEKEASMTPDFFKWLDEVEARHSDLIQKLAGK